MNEVAKYLRDELALVAKAKSLGLSHTIDHDKAVLICRRAAEEIERLDGPDPHGYKAAAEENLRRLSEGGAN